MRFGPRNRYKSRVDVRQVLVVNKVGPEFGDELVPGF